MKLLLCTLDYPPQVGGVATYYANLLSAWPDAAAWQVLDNNQEELLSKKGPWRWRRSVAALVKTVRRERPELVFLGQILPLGTAALLARLIVPFEFGLFLHGMDLTFALKTPRKRFLARLILKKARVIVCANSQVKKILLTAWPKLADKIILLHPGATAAAVDQKTIEDLRRRYDLNGKKVIFSIARLVKRKGFDQVITALDQVAGENWRYLLAGDGPEAAALRTAASAGQAADKIIFTGALSETEKWSCLKLCDIFIMTSRDLDGDFEGFGIVYLEANLMGKPVIAGRSGGVADAVIDNETGLLVDPENPTAIAAAITRLLNNPDEAERLGRLGKDRAERDFSWPGQTNKLKQALEQLIV